MDPLKITPEQAAKQKEWDLHNKQMARESANVVHVKSPENRHQRRARLKKEKSCPA